ncbi:YceD family protein [Caldimonas tepidiphila]|uniref:YceD family protein n=1 Tax=Caldimonas tepidiphila TaxID=2315841 RepID=UPI000E5B41E7|nr:YceD family protein [Caldimonas tepidiphila]
MKAREFNPQRLDVQEFARAGGVLEGRTPTASLERLAAEAHPEAPPVGEVAWRAEGRQVEQRAHAPQVWLDLSARGEIHLECQRCLGPVQVPLEVRRSFRFVSDEARAAEEDVEAEEEVLALTRALDVPELIEDELLLALPLVPRHEECPQPLPMVAEDEEEEEEEPRPNPFAALEALRKPKS